MGLQANVSNLTPFSERRASKRKLEDPPPLGEEAWRLSRATVEELLALAEAQHLPSLRHRCEDFLLCQAPDDQRGLKVIFLRASERKAAMLAGVTPKNMTKM
ncbi:unnamed protein product [Effrenium voratum]|uniref:Uncharacterized protein n=1 Tax=Effrenium voratum TaxID=2562239 RepID=A0AA36JS16_9DINO|nr:unnamed protein product [Effrenium voratum]